MPTWKHKVSVSYLSNNLYIRKHVRKHARLVHNGVDVRFNQVFYTLIIVDFKTICFVLNSLFYKDNHS